MADHTHGRDDRGGQPSVDELSEDAQASYQFWRKMNMGHGAAMELVRQDGHRISREAPAPDPTTDFFERRYGFSEATAKSVTTRRDARSAHLHARDVVLPGRDQVDDGGFLAIVEMKRAGGAVTNREALTEAIAHEKRAGRGDHVPAWATDLLEGRTPDELQESAPGSAPLGPATREEIIAEGLGWGMTDAKAAERADNLLAERRRTGQKRKGRKRRKAQTVESVFVELKESEAVSLFGKLGLSPEAATRAAGVTKGATS